MFLALRPTINERENMKKVLIAWLIYLTAISLCVAQDSGSATETLQLWGSMNVYSLAWDTDTNVNTTVNLTKSMDGEILRVVFTNSIGARAPSNDYDVAVNDPDGVDMLNGAGTNLATNVVSSLVPYEEIVINSTTQVVSMAVNGKGQLQITNAGTNTQGVIKFYYR